MPEPLANPHVDLNNARNLTRDPILALTLQYGGVKMGEVHTLKEWDAIMGDTKGSVAATLEQMLAHYAIETASKP